MSNDQKNMNAGVNEEEEAPTILQLETTNGEVVNYELLDVVEYEDNEYIVVAPAEVSEIDEVEIYRVEEDPENEEMEYYMPLETKEEVDAVYNVFKERNAEFFDFAD